MQKGRENGEKSRGKEGRKDGKKKTTQKRKMLSLYCWEHCSKSLQPTWVLTNGVPELPQVLQLSVVTALFQFDLYDLCLVDLLLPVFLQLLIPGGREERGREGGREGEGGREERGREGGREGGREEGREREGGREGGRDRGRKREGERERGGGEE